MAMDRNAEIDQIKRELETLRARHALYERWGRILRTFLTVWLPLFVLAIVAIAVYFFQFDIAYGVFFGGMTLVIGGFFWLINKIWPLRPLFWVDLVSPLPIGRSQMFPRKGFRSDAEIIGQQIAVREHRLSELGAAG